MVATQQDFYIGITQTLKDGLIGGTYTIGGLHTSILDSVTPSLFRTGLNWTITEQVYRLIMGIGHLTGGALEQLLAHLPLPGGDQPPTRQQLLMVGSINGAFGDWLAQQQRAWALRMQLCQQGRVLSLAPETLPSQLINPHPHVVVFVHGLCLNDLHWQPQDKPGFGQQWERTAPITCLYLRYNTGLHIHDNGRQLATLLQDLHDSYPIPIERLTLIGHSMGGLVARSACSYAQDANYAWVTALREVACLGSPHQGAGLERLGQWVTRALDSSRLTTPLGQAGKYRSAGIKDLRYACLRHEDWATTHPDDHQPLQPTPVPWLDHVRYCLVATNWKPATQESVGDGLVQVSSALAINLPQPTAIIRQPQRHLLQGLHHMHLVSHGDVYQPLTQWLFSAAPHG